MAIRTISLIVLIMAGILTLTAPTAAMAAEERLFDRLGGMKGITRIVDELTAMSLTHPRVKHTFDNTNIPRFKKRLVDQLCDLSGGPCTYKGLTMRKSHKPLKINTAQFNALVEVLQDAMDKTGVPFSAQNRLLALLAPMKRDIVTR